MKHLFFAVCLAVFFASCFNGVVGSGKLVTETRKVNNFTAVNTSASIDVMVEQGEQFKVEVTADDNLIQYVKATVDAGILKLYIDGVNSFSSSDVKVYVVMPKVTDLTSTSSSSIESKGVLTSTESISLRANSSGSINVQLSTPKVVADASSSADIDATGTTQAVQAEASSSGSINFKGLKAENVTASASSSADIEVFCSVQLKAQANSSGSVNYTGGVTNVSVEENSSGSVSKID
jgi:hypothetical protein